MYVSVKKNSLIKCV